jgi:hypothetical protein
LRVARNIRSQRSSTAKGSAPRRIGVRYWSDGGGADADVAETGDAVVGRNADDESVGAVAGAGRCGATQVLSGGEMREGSGDPPVARRSGRHAERDDLDVGDLHRR